MKQLQEAIGKHNEKFGLLRGEPSDKKYLEMNKFKREALKEEIKELEQQKLDHEKAAAQISGRLDDLKKTAFEAQAVDQIEVKEKGGLLKAKTVQMSKEDFEQLQKVARAGEVFKRDNKSLETELVRERSRTKELSKENDRLKSENRSLKAEKKELETENRFLKRSISAFLTFFGEKQKEYRALLGYAKAHILTKMNMKITEKYFDHKDEAPGANKFISEENERKQNARTAKKNNDMEMER
ncbi:hypothetical protein ACLF6N_22065 (plasmid) [Bacillus subtilis]